MFTTNFLSEQLQMCFANVSGLVRNSHVRNILLLILLLKPNWTALIPTRVLKTPVLVGLTRLYALQLYDHNRTKAIIQFSGVPCKRAE